MTRKATDLLDVFRAERPSAARPASARATGEGAPPRERRAFEGLFLVPRQLLLGSSVVLLLLVFAFVLGVSVGRRGGAADGAPALARAAQRDDAGPALRTYVVTRVPYVDKRGPSPNDPQRVAASLTEYRGVELERLWVTDEPKAEAWRLILGPFRDEREAREYLASKNLTRASLGGVRPFERPDFVALPPEVLPRERLPRR